MRRFVRAAMKRLEWTTDPHAIANHGGRIGAGSAYSHAHRQFHGERKRAGSIPLAVHSHGDKRLHNLVTMFRAGGCTPHDNNPQIPDDHRNNHLLFPAIVGRHRKWLDNLKLRWLEPDPPMPNTYREGCRWCLQAESLRMQKSATEKSSSGKRFFDVGSKFPFRLWPGALKKTAAVRKNGDYKNNKNKNGRENQASNDPQPTIAFRLNADGLVWITPEFRIKV